MANLFQRKSLDEITRIPDDLISVYVVENHIWAEGGAAAARQARRAETRTVAEFLIDPVRAFLNDIFRQMSAPYRPERKDAPIGQGYWIQAEFGSGKSHLLSFVGALALGGAAEWDIVREKERKAGLGKRDSLYAFYENGLQRKAEESKGIFVAVKTLVGEGGGAIGMSGASRSLVDYVLDAVGRQFFLETGRSLPLYPTEILAERFLTTGDFERYRRDLTVFLRDPAYFDEEEQEELGDFLHDLQNPDPGVQRDCGQKLWDFYERYLQIRPQIPLETEAVLKHAVERLLEEGYAGLLLILDEVSLFMKGRDDAQRVEDEKALVVLSNRLAKVENLPVWLVCAAQQKIESTMAGVKNIIARERLDLVPLLNDQDTYYDIALSRVREVTDPAAVDQYYEDYKRSFSWPQAVGKERFAQFFPFYPSSIDVIRALSYQLTTMRSALYFLLQTLKTQRKARSRELISLWALFDDVVTYEEDPSGTTRSIANIKTKWPEEWKAYETARQQLDRAVKGPLKVYRSRCEKLVKTLFLYHIANLVPGGLSRDELLNAVMEWKDQTTGQEADLQDNQDHYEVLIDQLALELVQVEKVGQRYQFKPEGGRVDPLLHFQRARAEAESNEVQRREAWEALLALERWDVMAGLLRMELTAGVQSLFREIAPARQTDVTVIWRNREVTGRVYMRDLASIGQRQAMIPSINSAETGLDFAVYVSSTPAEAQLEGLAARKDDPRIIFWSPDALTATEVALLLDFAAYRALVGEHRGQDTEDARIILEWVQNRLRNQLATIYRIVVDSYNRGRMAAVGHSQLTFSAQGELTAICAPLVGQLLDGVYLSRELTFDDAPAPFNDLNAINVINGVVRVGEIEHGAKPTKEVSAARNYGIGLQIMRRPNNTRLNLAECRYTRDMLAWLEEKLGDSGAALPVDALYKNFMGLNGPGGQHYGLSRRMVQLYLLCLVQQGKVRLTLSGKAAPVETLDYSNIASVTFKVATLEAFDRIQRLKPPAGWALLAPYAAVLLDRPALRDARQDADVQQAVLDLLHFKAQEAARFPAWRAEFTALLDELSPHPPTSLAPHLSHLAQWETFLTREIDPTNALPYLLEALRLAFGYRAYHDERVDLAEVDDLATRRAEIAQSATFYGYRDRLRSAAQYARWAAALPELPADPVLRDAATALAQTHARLGDLRPYLESEIRLRNELLEPAETAIESYGARYLHAFEQVSARAEQSREALAALTGSADFRALGRLARVLQLGGDLRPAVQAAAQQAAADLFPAGLSRAAVQQGLRAWPQPSNCPLTLANAEDWLRRADEAVARGQAALEAALLEKARLLHSSALRERLAQHAGEPFIAALLAAADAPALAEVLRATLGADPLPEPDPVALLARALKQLQVRKLRLRDFAPGKRTLERADVDALVAEFRAFLLSALTSNDDDTLPIVELEI